MHDRKQRRLKAGEDQLEGEIFFIELFIHQVIRWNLGIGWLRGTGEKSFIKFVMNAVVNANYLSYQLVIFVYLNKDAIFFPIYILKCDFCQFSIKGIALKI